MGLGGLSLGGCSCNPTVTTCLIVCERRLPKVYISQLYLSKIFSDLFISHFFATQLTPNG